MPWNTNAAEFAGVVAEFERRLPGFWWSVGMCKVGAHASCGVDANAEQGALVAHVTRGNDDPLDSGFHVDTSGGTVCEALRNVMEQALADPRIIRWNQLAETTKPEKIEEVWLSRYPKWAKEMAASEEELFQRLEAAPTNVNCVWTPLPTNPKETGLE